MCANVGQSDGPDLPSIRPSNTFMRDESELMMKKTFRVTEVEHVSRPAGGTPSRHPHLYETLSPARKPTL